MIEKKKIHRNVLMALSALSLPLVLTACSSVGVQQADTGSIEFANISYPVSDAEKRLVRGSPSVKVDGKTYSIGFQTILRSGDQRGGGVFGQLFDSQGKPIL